MSGLAAGHTHRYPPIRCTTRSHLLDRRPGAARPDMRVAPGSCPRPVTIRQTADTPRTFALARSSCRIRALLYASPTTPLLLRRDMPSIGHPVTHGVAIQAPAVRQ